MMQTALFGIWLFLFGLCTPHLFARVAFIPIKSIHFEGNTLVGDVKLKSLLRLSREGRGFTAENLDSDLHRVETAYRDMGFLQAKVGPPIVEIQTQENEEVAVIRIPVAEGSLYRVGLVSIRNAKALGTETLMQMCPLKKGETYSRAKARQWQAQIEEAYRTLGYIKYHGIAHENLSETDGVVDFDLECVEGEPYSVGKITIIGDESIDPKDVKRHLLFSEGRLFNPEMLTLSIRFLNQQGLYGPISHSDVDISVDEAKNVVDVTLRLRRPESKSR
jgi:outer membrane protein insertion porin family